VARLRKRVYWRASEKIITHMISSTKEEKIASLVMDIMDKEKITTNIVIIGITQFISTTLIQSFLATAHW
jgi:hypothetical protein